MKTVIYKVRNYEALPRKNNKSIVCRTESIPLFTLKISSIVYEATKNSKSFTYKNVFYKVRNHKALQRKSTTYHREKFL